MGGEGVRLLYIVSFSVAGVLCLSGLVGVRSLDTPDVRRGLAALLVLCGVWSLVTALQFVIPSHAIQRGLHLVALIVGIGTVFAWLAFASAYAGRQYHRQRYLQLTAVAIFVAIISVKLTNPLHGFYFTSSAATEPFPHIEFSYRAPHWFVTGFSYTATAVGFLWLFESFDSRDSRPTVLYALVGITAVPILPYVVSQYSESILAVNYEPLGVAVFVLGVLFYARTEFEHYSSPAKSTLADSLSDGGIVLDDTGNVINYNDRAAEILGYSAIPRAPLTEIDTALADIDTGETRRISYEVDGYKRTYELKRSPIPESQIATEIITFKDITRARRLEAVMGLHREISESLVDATDPWDLIRTVPEAFAKIDAYDLVWLYPVPDGDSTEDGRIRTEPSDPFEGSSGTFPGIASGDETAYLDWGEETPEPGEPVLEAADTGIATSVSFADTDAEWSIRARQHGLTGCLAVPIRLSGQQSYVLGVYTTAPDGFDTPERTVIQEISERIPQAVETIEAHEEALRYKEAIKHAGAAISITDIEGQIQYVNPEFENLTGYGATEAIGETPKILNSDEMNDQHYERLWETILSGDVFEDQFINKTKAGDRYIAQETISPVTDDDGEPKAFVAIQFDITNKLLREQRLSVLNRVLRHNLRSSINVINAHASLLEDRLESASEQSRESLETIQRQTDQLLALSETAREIEHILAADHQELATVDKLAETARAIAGDLESECRVEIDGAVAGQRVDAELELIVEELVENAIVHSKGPVDLSVTFGRESDDLILTVEDDGPGMSDQELVVIEDGEENPLKHGSGLGLWLVNWLSISRGGSVSAKTGQDGTTIRVNLPLRGADTESQPNETA